MLGDERDEALNGYDTLIRSLRPGAAGRLFRHGKLQCRTECLSWTGCIPRRANISTSPCAAAPRRPTSCSAPAMPLVDKLQQRIDEAVARYIAELERGRRRIPSCRGGRAISAMPAPGRRGCAIAAFTSTISIPKAGSVPAIMWRVPEAVKDETARQGWIKFGEPALGCGAEKSRSAAPSSRCPGRLVLFPSYMWHGTVPFHDSAAAHHHRVRCGAEPKRARRVCTGARGGAARLGGRHQGQPVAEQPHGIAAPGSGAAGRPTTIS